MLLEDFYANVLQKLGVLAAEESPTASDRDVVAVKYEQIREKYYRRDLVNWFDDDDVPDWIADDFASMVGFRLTDTFSVDAEKYVKMKLAHDDGETTLIADGQRRAVPSENPEYY